MYGKESKYLSAVSISLILVLALACACLGADVMVSETGETVVSDAGSASNPSLLQYVPQELLIKVKEGRSISDFVNTYPSRIKDSKRIHSIKKVTRKVKSKHSFHKNSRGEIILNGNVFASVEDIPDDDLFDLAYSDFPPKKQGIYRKHKIRLHEDVSMEEALEIFAADPSVEYAYPNYLRRVTYTPDDPMIPDQWSLPRVNAFQAWDYAQGEGLVIAVIDTGVDYNHEDLFANIWVNPAVVPDVNLDGAVDILDLDLDGSNSIDQSELDAHGVGVDTAGYDFVSVDPSGVAVGEDPGPPDNDPMDVHSHGTHCSGIAAAVYDNEVGIAGLAPKARIMALRAGYKAPNGGGYLADADIEQAILYAVDNGADIISMSFGGASQGAFLDELQYAYSQNVVLVGSAGNDGYFEPSYPAGIEEVLAVGAASVYDDKALYSNYGDWIDLVAPGSSVISTVPGNGYAYKSGTSMAAPHVAAAAALVLSSQPGITNEEVGNVLKSSTLDLDFAGRDGWTGYGGLDAEYALLNGSTSTCPKSTISAPLPYAILRGDTSSAVGTAAGAGHISYDLYMGLSANGTPATGFEPIGSGTSVVDNVLASFTGYDYPHDITSTHRVLRLETNTTCGTPGLFSTPVRFDPTLLPGWPYRHKYNSNTSPTVADIDLDGQDEIIFTTTNYLNVYRGDGTPLWSANMASQFAQNPAVGELDPATPGLEIAIGCNWGCEEVYVFHSDGTIASGWPVTLNDYVFPPVIADFDGDGANEVLFSVAAGPDGTPEGGDGPRLYLYEGNGVLLPGWPVSFEGYAYKGVAAADIDNNGSYEIFASLSIDAGATDDSFVVAYDHSGTELQWISMSVSGTDAAFISNPVIADLEGDGRLEVAAATRNMGIYVWSVDSALHTVSLLPNWPQPVDVSYGYGNYRPLSMSDLDGDGELELLATANSFYSYAWKKDGSLFPGYPRFWYNAHVPDIVADIDGDKEVEVLHNTGSGGTYAYDVDGSLISGFPKFKFNYDNLYPPAVGDVDGDGKLDMVIKNREKKEFAVFTLGRSGLAPWPMEFHDAQNTSFFGHPVGDGLHAPNAFDDAASTDAGVPVNIAVLANDNDPDDDLLEVVSIVSPPAHGSAGINPDNTILYTPDTSFVGDDTLIYEISDGSNGYDSATVYITVIDSNDPPVAADDSAVADEDTAVDIAVLSNDTDADSDPLAVTDIPAPPANGTAAINPDNTVRYTPAPDYYGPDSFSYTVGDGNGGSDTANVSITVNAVNDAPVAADDSAVADEDTAADIAVLSNDTDADSDPLAVTDIPAPPANGIAAINPDNTVRYTPAPDYYGPDSFSYTVGDGNGGSDTANVSITVNAVNDAPVAADDSAQTVVDTAVVISVLSNDSDADEDALSVDSVTQGTDGMVVSNGDGTVTYTPNGGFLGVDSFSYTVSDGRSGFDTAAVTVTVEPMTMIVDSITMSTSTGKGKTKATASISVVDGLGAPVIQADVSGHWEGLTSDVDSGLTGANGILSVDSDARRRPEGIFTFVVDGVAKDGYTLDAQASVMSGSIEYPPPPPNQPPTAVDDNSSTLTDTPVVIAVLGNDSDPDGDALAVNSVTQPPNGGAFINPENTVTYTPAPGFIGVDTFTYSIGDGHGGTDGASVHVSVTDTPSEDNMHVSDISMGLILKKVTRATAAVLVVDEWGSPVAGVAVAGDWSNAVTGSVTGVTDALGGVELTSPGLKKASGSTFTFTVTGLVKDGWLYDPAANMETSDSIVVP